MKPPPFDSIRPIRWLDQRLELLDQRLLPGKEVWLPCESVGQVGQAIADMVVRGAPAIGITAAFGAVLSARARYMENPEHWQQDVRHDFSQLLKARPTAVNLGWALRRMALKIEELPKGDPTAELLQEAQHIHAEDISANYRIGELSLDLLPRGSLLTHCNAGALATGGYGTALGVARAGYVAGLIDRVYADETRPWLQGARLTAWELEREGIPVTLQIDAAAAALMRAGAVASVITGADRIAANGDVANKIGTYALAHLARAHRIPFLVAAPVSSIDMKVPDGDTIPVEERSSSEVTNCGGQPMAPAGVIARNPVFDITPAALVSAIITERGVVREPNQEKMHAMVRSQKLFS